MHVYHQSKGICVPRKRAEGNWRSKMGGGKLLKLKLSWEKYLLQVGTLENSLS